ncbi:MAG: signal recognition particle-docking protein FtsY [Thiotrichales bacterium]|nr:signal recognition particle-docking protein FtsY [Thiotrichales bacterium]
MFGFFRKKNKTAAPEAQPNSETLNESVLPESETQIDLPPVTETMAEIVAEKAEPPALPRPSQSEPADLFAKNEEASKSITPAAASASTPAEEPKKKGLFTRLKEGLSKTRKSFTDRLSSLILGRKEIDAELLEELEMILLTADVGVDATDRIIRNLTDQVSRKELQDPQALINALKEQLEQILQSINQPLDIASYLDKQAGPYVILMVGINGVGKTTTIGKLAKKFQLDGKSVMLAAGDTFRAAAVEQLQTWGERNKVTVVAQKNGADSAAVIFDALQSAKAKKIDILIADTAGRLHTQSNLMEELKKVKRVIAKLDGAAPHEVMLVIDAGTGQNALNQAKQFHEAVGVSGITLTKLDGTAKGGIVFALAEQAPIPIRFIGVGEKIDDLRPFDAKEFTAALFDVK